MTIFNCVNSHEYFLRMSITKTILPEIIEKPSNSNLSGMRSIICFLPNLILLPNLKVRDSFGESFKLFNFAFFAVINIITFNGVQLELPADGHNAVFPFRFPQDWRFLCYAQVSFK